MPPKAQGTGPKRPQREEAFWGEGWDENAGKQWPIPVQNASETASSYSNAVSSQSSHRQPAERVPIDALIASAAEYPNRYVLQDTSIENMAAKLSQEQEMVYRTKVFREDKDFGGETKRETTLRALLQQHMDIKVRFDKVLREFDKVEESLLGVYGVEWKALDGEVESLTLEVLKKMDGQERVEAVKRIQDLIVMIYQEIDAMEGEILIRKAKEEESEARGY